MKIVVLDGYAENPGDLSWASKEARLRMMAMAASNLRTFLRGIPENQVNGKETER